jgi:hypothetical protein
MTYYCDHACTDEEYLNCWCSFRDDEEYWRSVDEFDDYYRSIAELNDDLWAVMFGTRLSTWTDPLPTTREHESIHKTVKTKKKPEKRKMKEQRAKQKKKHRIDVVREIQPEEASDHEE